MFRMVITSIEVDGVTGLENVVCTGLVGIELEVLTSPNQRAALQGETLVGV